MIPLTSSSRQWGHPSPLKNADVFIEKYGFFQAKETPPDILRDGHTYYIGLGTGGPRLVRLLGTGKNRTMRNLF